MENNMTDKEAVTIIKQEDVERVEIKLRSDGIMQFDLKICDHFSISDLKEANAASDLLGGGKVFPRLVFVNHSINFDKEVRKYGATEESNAKVSAVAFVTNFLHLKYVGNFYITFNKPVRPTQIFNSKEKAVEWLKTFL